MHQLRTWGRRLLGQEPRPATIPRGEQLTGTEPYAVQDARVARAMAERPPWRAQLLDGPVEQHGWPARDARADAQRIEQRWQALDPAAQRAAVLQANRRGLDDPPTAAELRADAHERVARLVLGQPGRGTAAVLPPSYLDVRPVPRSPAAPLPENAAPRWELVHYAYHPDVRGHVPQTHRAADDAHAIVAYALDAHAYGSPPPPVYTEDRALRTELAVQHLILGGRLTGIAQEEAALLQTRHRERREHTHELER